MIRKDLLKDFRGCNMIAFSHTYFAVVIAALILPIVAGDAEPINRTRFNTNLSMPIETAQSTSVSNPLRYCFSAFLSSAVSFSLFLDLVIV